MRFARLLRTFEESEEEIELVDSSDRRVPRQSWTVPQNLHQNLAHMMAVDRVLLRAAIANTEYHQ